METIQNVRESEFLDTLSVHVRHLATAYIIWQVWLSPTESEVVLALDTKEEEGE